MHKVIEITRALVNEMLQHVTFCFFLLHRCKAWLVQEIVDAISGLGELAIVV